MKNCKPRTKNHIMNTSTPVMYIQQLLTFCSFSFIYLSFAKVSSRKLQTHEMSASRLPSADLEQTKDPSHTIITPLSHLTATLSFFFFLNIIFFFLCLFVKSESTSKGKKHTVKDLASSCPSSSPQNSF